MIELKKNLFRRVVGPLHEAVQRCPPLSITYDQRLRYGLIMRRLRAVHYASVLDVGCGPGLLGKLLEIRGNGVVYAELHSEFLKDIRGDKVHCSGVHLPFIESAFEYVISSDVLEHLSPKERFGFVREILRTSRTLTILTFCFRQKILILEKLCRMFRANLPEWYLEHQQFSPPNIIDVRRMISSVGYDILEETSFEGKANTVLIALFCGLPPVLSYPLKFLAAPFVVALENPPFLSACLVCLKAPKLQAAPLVQK